jgi:hypothetical protein
MVQPMSETWLYAGLAFVGGAALGVVVTRNLHGNPKKKFWSEPVGGGLRRANLPVGGTIAGAAAAVLFALGQTDAAVIVAGGALGMAISATGWGFIDPLDRARP